MTEQNKSLHQGLLIVVSGPSGTGKGTICSRLLQSMPDLKLSISATTRLPRIGEVDGKNYYFMTREKFETMKNNNEFLETANVYNNYYGTPKKPVLDILNRGENLILEIDIQGALQVKKNYPEGIFVFIVPPSLQELENRIRNRGTETEDVIQKRLSCAQAEIEHYVDYNYIIINDNLDTAVDKIKTVISAELYKPERMKHKVEKILRGNDRDE